MAREAETGEGDAGPTSMSEQHPSSPLSRPTTPRISPTKKTRATISVSQFKKMMSSTRLERSDTVSINSHYNDDGSNLSAALPDDIFLSSFRWLDELEICGKVSLVCKTWGQLSGSPLVWESLFEKRFVTPEPEDNDPIHSGDCRKVIDFRQRYRRRLANPIPGDGLEVAWHGKFRLENQSTFFGLSWWEATIVEVSEELSEDEEGILSGTYRRYKVHYPGWNARWDEWVPPGRLRWPLPKHATRGLPLQPGMRPLEFDGGEWGPHPLPALGHSPYDPPLPGAPPAPPPDRPPAAGGGAGPTEARPPHLHPPRRNSAPAGRALGRPAAAAAGRAGAGPAAAPLGFAAAGARLVLAGDGRGPPQAEEQADPFAALEEVGPGHPLQRPATPVPAAAAAAAAGGGGGGGAPGVQAAAAAPPSPRGALAFEEWLAFHDGRRGLAAEWGLPRPGAAAAGTRRGRAASGFSRFGLPGGNTAPFGRRRGPAAAAGAFGGGRGGGGRGGGGGPRPYLVEVWCTGTRVKGAWLEARVECAAADRARVADFGRRPQAFWTSWCNVAPIRPRTIAGAPVARPAASPPPHAAPGGVPGAAAAAAAAAAAVAMRPPRLAAAGLRRTAAAATRRRRRRRQCAGSGDSGGGRGGGGDGGGSAVQSVGGPGSAGEPSPRGGLCSRGGGCAVM